MRGSHCQHTRRRGPTVSMLCCRGVSQTVCTTIDLCIMVKATRLKPLPRTSQNTERPLGPLGSLELPTAVCLIGFNHIGGLVCGGETPCAIVTNPPMRNAAPVTSFTCESIIIPSDGQSWALSPVIFTNGSIRSSILPPISGPRAVSYPDPLYTGVGRGA